MVEKAIAFATKAHEGQVRKGTRRPYIVHPLEVGEIVSEMTDDEEVIAAAVLHDTIEDCEEVTEEMLRREFGERVASMVAHESEDKVVEGTKKRDDRISASCTPRTAVYRIGGQAVQYTGYCPGLSGLWGRTLEAFPYERQAGDRMVLYRNHEIAGKFKRNASL